MEIRGRFNKVIYHNTENGYLVAVFQMQEKYSSEEIIVVGYFGALDMDREYQLEGDYVEHPKYGIQFKTESYQKVILSDHDDLIRYFSSQQFYGIGKKYATVLVESLGNDIISMIKANPDCLDGVSKMTQKKKEAIIEGLNQEQDDDIIFLSSHHLSTNNIFRLKKKYEDNLMGILIDNPYQVIKDVSGIGFTTIDKFAMSIGIKEDNFNRLAALSEEILMEICMRSGDSYVEDEFFYQQLDKEIGVYNQDISLIIDTLLMDRRIVLEENRFYPISQYESEKFISQFLMSFPYEPIEKFDEETIDDNLNQIQRLNNIEYQDRQLEAIRAFFNQDSLIVTGGPGTGKTTIVKAMMNLSQYFYPSYNTALLAPTGRAAKRLSELTNCSAKTIHSILLWDKETGTFSHDQDNPINVDILIIDEFSMVDQWLFYNLLKACQTVKKIIMIGDADQLPSVAMGALLRDLIDSDLIKTIKLDKIYRQKEGSDIISLAYDIKSDCCYEIPVENDIRFIECNNNQINDVVSQVVEKSLALYPSLEEGFMNVQVLAPKHMGLNGINNLNNALQQRFNPKDKYKREIKWGYKVFRENDKILQLKNQPDDDVFNGDIGIISEIIYAKEDINNQNRIICDFDGRIVEYTSETFSNITHAYCMSVHKAQGSEYPIVIMPLSKEYNIMLQKRLIYTAITRAYKNLIFVGDKQAFFIGINKKDYYQRKTTLKERLVKLHG